MTERQYFGLLPVYLAMAATIACGTVDPGHNDCNEFPDGARDAFLDAPVTTVCKPDWRGCIMGLKAECSRDGSYVDYTSCPAGRVCLDNDCVDNTATVYLVTGEPPSDGIMQPQAIPAGCGCPSGPDLPPCVAKREAEQLNPTDFHGAAPGFGSMLFGDIILLQRMAVRRLLTDLRQNSGLRFALFHKPSVVGDPAVFKFGEPFHRWISGNRVTPETYYPEDWDISKWFGQVPGFRQWYFNHVGEVYFARPEPVGGIPCLPDLTWEDDDWPSTLTQMVLAVPPWGTAETVGLWVDERSDVLPVGPACDDQSDCEGSVCYSGSCAEVSNPELPGRLLDSQGNTCGIPDRSPMLFYASNVAARLGRMQGLPCRKDADCQDPLYRCNQGTCDDPARFCRRHHIVVFAQRDCQPESMAQREEIAPLEGNWLPYWLRHGVWKPCESDLDCPGPQKCTQYWPYWGGGESPPDPPWVCVPDFWIASGIDAGIGKILQCEGPRPVRFENSYPLDREGHRISFTTHQVDMIWREGFAAVYGGGLSTTLGYNCELGDWEDGLSSIASAIVNDLHDYQCSVADIPQGLLPGLKNLNAPSFEWDAVPGAVCGKQHKDYPAM